MTFRYRCTECGREYPLEPGQYLCPVCSKRQEETKPLRGVLRVVPPEPALDAYRKSRNPWHLLPVPARFFPPVPWTPSRLWAPENLRRSLGFSHLFLKDDTGNPTGSLKDRASLLVAAFARQHGLREVVVASTGNAGSSMAGIGAAAGLRVTLWIPATAPPAKLVQALQYGARVVPVRGTYDKAFDLSLAYSQRTGALSRNTAYNPLTIEGKKTVALEFVEQMPVPPAHVFVPTGDGVILAGVYRGLEDLIQAGLLATMPRVYAVQAEGSNALARAFRQGDFSDPQPARTLADSIAVEVPRNGYYALKLLQDYGGTVVEVSDEEILEAQRLLASRAGLFAEPAAAASLAGFLRVKHEIPAHDPVVLLITGTGLKDIEAARRGAPPLPEPVESLEEVLREY